MSFILARRRVSLAALKLVPLFALFTVVFGSARLHAQPAIEPPPETSGKSAPAVSLAAKSFTISPIPKWVEDVTPKFTPTPPEDVNYGYDYQLIDRQVDVRKSEEFEHYIYRITSESALQSGASVSASFDPTYEKLQLHFVRVIRDNKTQNRLKESSVKIIQQERDLDRYMLNGRLTALLVLEDIRAGDIIEYAFTRSGWNPVFGSHYMDHFSAGWSVPVRHQHLRITIPSGTQLQHQSLLQTTLGLTVTKSDTATIYTWIGTDLSPISSDGDLPSWFTPVPSIQVTDFPTWAKVNEWALPLYSIPDPIPVKILAKAGELTADITDRDAQAIALLQFVQQEIRYLGLELGPGSHRPTPPEEVLERRFGDCKDKTLLFCTLMRAIGQEAYPALLNTTFRDRIGAWLPSPYAFDHVIASIPRGDGFWWVDPTMTDQKGGPLHRGLPDYRLALVVKKGTKQLTLINRPDGAGRRIKIEEQFEITAFDKPAELKVVSRYTGLSADSIRSYLADTALTQISKDYVNHYTSPYPGLTPTKDVTWVDDVSTNTVTVEENYSVPGLWKDTENGRVKAEFYPETISDYVNQPNTRVRTMPLRVSHPFNIELTTHVHLPKIWKITPDEATIESPAFRAQYKMSLDGRYVTMNYKWTSLADFVPPEKTQEHITAVQKTRSALGYVLSYDKTVDSAASAQKSDKAEPTVEGIPFRINWLLVVIMMGTGIVMYHLSRWTFARPGISPPPPPRFDELGLVGLSGWLVLIGLVTVLRPIGFTYQFLSSTHWAFNLTTWELLTTPGGDSYNAYIEPTVLTGVAFYTAAISCTVLLVFLFFLRKKTFPTTFVWFTVTVFAFQCADLVVFHLIENSVPDKESTASDIFLNGIQLAIWIPYLLQSRRVRLTFTR